jgi:hypothetical protein
VTLRRLRATLAAWGADGAEIAAIDAWAKWMMLLTHASKDAGPDAPVYTSLDTAIMAALDVTLRALATVAGVSEQVRRAVWIQAYAGNELVTTLLLTRSQRRAKPAAETAAPAPAPSAPLTVKSPTQAPRPTNGGARR